MKNDIDSRAAVMKCSGSFSGNSAVVRLFGQTLSRRQVAERCGSLSQFAGVRLMTLGDGVERGVRMLEFRTGAGLRFTVLVDRAMDIAECEYKGQAIGWHSPTGFRHPGLHEYEGEDGLAWARSFSGFLVTCGLDHILSPVRNACRQLQLPRQEARASFASRPDQHDPGPTDRVWRELDWRQVRSVGRGRRSAVRRCSARTCISFGASKRKSARTRSAFPIAS